MPSSARRVFNLMDAFFLIVATSIGLAIWRNDYFFSSGGHSKACRRAILAIWASEGWFSCA